MPWQKGTSGNRKGRPKGAKGRKKKAPTPASWKPGKQVEGSKPWKPGQSGNPDGAGLTEIRLFERAIFRLANATGNAIQLSNGEVIAEIVADQIIEPQIQQAIEGEVPSARLLFDEERQYYKSDYAKQKALRAIQAPAQYRSCPDHVIPSYPAVPARFRLFVEGRYRMKIARSGRGGGKSHAVAHSIMCIIAGLTEYWQQPVVVMVVRLTKLSVKDSFFELLRNKAVLLNIMPDLEFTRTEIRHKVTGSRIIMHGFYGAEALQQSIKSVEGVNICVIEEADTLTHEHLEIIDPTIRAEGSEIWMMFNPSVEHTMAYVVSEKAKTDSDWLLIDTSYKENAYISQTFIDSAEKMRVQDFEKYKHIYLGEPLKYSDAKYLAKKTTVLSAHEMPSTEEGELFRGIDFGGRLAYVEARLLNGNIYIEHEYCSANQANLQGVISHLRARYKKEGRRSIVIYGDGAQPTDIALIAREGFHCVEAKKPPGSVIRGYEYFLERHIYIAEHCEASVYEFQHIERKYDRVTGEWLAEPSEHGLPGAIWHDHAIDAVRYALHKRILGLKRTVKEQ